MLERLKNVGKVEKCWKGWNILERLKYVGKVEICWKG